MSCSIYLNYRKIGSPNCLNITLQSISTIDLKIIELIECILRFFDMSSTEAICEESYGKKT